jgi:hypothetical protein
VSKKAGDSERSAQEFDSYEVGNGTEGEWEKKEQNSAPIRDAGASRSQVLFFSAKLVRSESNAIANALYHELALREELP